MEDTNYFKKSSTISTKSTIYIIISCFALVTMCSKCSFVYQINPWCDPNFYITVARKMQQGQVLYRDIFEQKGPIIFYIHYIACSIFENLFIGMYIFELLICVVNVIIIFKIFKIYMRSEIKATIGTIATLCLIYTSNTFVTGDSAEEFCFPLLLYGLYCVLQYENGKCLNIPNYVMIGCACGLIFWTKYTLIGCYIGLGLYYIVILAHRKDFREIAKCIIAVIIGFVLTTFAITAYFLINHAVNDLIFSYFVVNTKYYAAHNTQKDWPIRLVQDVSMLLSNCPVSVILIALGMMYYSRKKEFASLLIALITTVAPLLLGTHIWTYYYYPLQMFTIFGIIFLLNKYSKIIPFVVASTGILFMIHAYENISADQSWLYAFKPWFQQVENPTLYLFQCEEAEFYTAYNIIPDEKYFITWNVQFPQMEEEQKEAVIDGEHDFIITEVPQHFQGYQCVDQTTRIENGYSETFYLYQHIANDGTN